MFLAVINHSSPNLDIRRVRDLSPEEQEAFREANRAFFRYLNFKFAPQMVFDNDAAFFSAMEDRLTDFLKTQNPRRPFKLFQYTTVANRYLVNYLASITFFLNYTERKLKIAFGTNSDEVRRFTAATNEAFDTSFAYRFMYKLRNYSQHCDHPVGTVSIRMRPHDIENSTLEMHCVTEQLLREFTSWGVRVKADLEQREKVDLITSVRQMTSHIHDLSDLAVPMLVPELTSAVHVMRSIIGNAIDDGEPILASLETDDGSVSSISYISFPLDEMDALDSP